MTQLYFLSILCNSLGGYILFAGKENEGGAAESTSIFSLSNPICHLVLGILSAVVGFLKLLSPMPVSHDRVVLILGDLIPAAAGVTAGLLLVFGLYRQSMGSGSEAEGELDRLGINLLRFRKTFGLGLLAAALLHFLFPQALFL